MLSADVAGSASDATLRKPGKDTDIKLGVTAITCK
jgi:hypothetical protein